MNQAAVRKRINITLPEETIKIIDDVAEKGERSRFLDEAVRFYVGRKSKSGLKKLLREGAAKRTERDLLLAKEWFSIEEDSWQRKQTR